MVATTILLLFFFLLLLLLLPLLLAFLSWYTRIYDHIPLPG